MQTLLYRALLLERGMPSFYFTFLPQDSTFISICHQKTDFLFFFFGSRASDYGLVKFDSSGRVIQFSEKPKGAALEEMVSIHLLLTTQICIGSFQE